ncbi:unnamed protein product [Closterium sp. Naga37s-1]|nr:unnamed protein product [Closterium sp. Naga37s-1]
MPSQSRGRHVASPSGADAQWDAHWDPPAFRRWLLGFAAVRFDLEQGQLVEALFPAGALSAEEETDVAFSSFPDSMSAVHSRASLYDCLFFFRIRRRGVPPALAATSGGVDNGAGSSGDGTGEGAGRSVLAAQSPLLQQQHVHTSVGLGAAGGAATRATSRAERSAASARRQSASPPRWDPGTNRATTPGTTPRRGISVGHGGGPAGAMAESISAPASTLTSPTGLVAAAASPFARLDRCATEPLAGGEGGDEAEVQWRAQAGAGALRHSASARGSAGQREEEAAVGRSASMGAGRRAMPAHSQDEDDRGGNGGSGGGAAAAGGAGRGGARYLYGFVFNRQRHDERLPRGGEQKSVVVLSERPFSAAFRRLAQVVGPLYFDRGPIAFVQVAAWVSLWPAPYQPSVVGGGGVGGAAGGVMELPVGPRTSLRVQLPPAHTLPPASHSALDDFTAAMAPAPLSTSAPQPMFSTLHLHLPLTPYTVFLSPPNHPSIHSLTFPMRPPSPSPLICSPKKGDVLGSSHPCMHPPHATTPQGIFHDADVFGILRGVAAQLWVLWELLLLGEPLLVIAPTPAQCSEAVAALVGLIAPLPCSQDFRPYFTIHDPDFPALNALRDGDALPAVVLGVTNLFFLKALKHLPHVLSVGRPPHGGQGVAGAARYGAGAGGSLQPNGQVAVRESAGRLPHQQQSPLRRLATGGLLRQGCSSGAAAAAPAAVPSSGAFNPHPLPTHCPPIAHPLPTHCPPIAHPLPTHCPPIAVCVLSGCGRCKVESSQCCLTPLLSLPSSPYSHPRPSPSNSIHLHPRLSTPHPSVCPGSMLAAGSKGLARMRGEGPLSLMGEHREALWTNHVPAVKPDTAVLNRLLDASTALHPSASHRTHRSGSSATNAADAAASPADATSLASAAAAAAGVAAGGGKGGRPASASAPPSAAASLFSLPGAVAGSLLAGVTGMPGLDDAAEGSTGGGGGGVGGRGAGVSGETVAMVNNEVLRRHFIELTTNFLAPFGPFLRAAAPPPDASPYCDPPPLPPFDAAEFLGQLAARGPGKFLAKRLQAGRWLEVYRRFLEGPNFMPWFQRRRAVAEAEQHRLWRAARLRADVRKAVGGMGEADLVEAFLCVERHMAVESKVRHMAVESKVRHMAVESKAWRRAGESPAVGKLRGDLRVLWAHMPPATQRLLLLSPAHAASLQLPPSSAPEDAVRGSSAVSGSGESGDARWGQRAREGTGSGREGGSGAAAAQGAAAAAVGRGGGWAGWLFGRRTVESSGSGSGAGERRVTAGSDGGRREEAAEEAGAAEAGRGGSVGAAATAAAPGSASAGLDHNASSGDLSGDSSGGVGGSGGQSGTVEMVEAAQHLSALVANLSLPPVIALNGESHPSSNPGKAWSEASSPPRGSSAGLGRTSSGASPRTAGIGWGTDMWDGSSVGLTSSSARSSTPAHPASTTPSSTTSTGMGSAAHVAGARFAVSPVVPFGRRPGLSVGRTPPRLSSSAPGTPLHLHPGGTFLHARPVPAHSAAPHPRGRYTGGGGAGALGGERLSACASAREEAGSGGVGGMEGGGAMEGGGVRVGRTATEPPREARGAMSFMRGDLLQKARLLMRGGVVDPPKWLDALSKCVGRGGGGMGCWRRGGWGGEWGKEGWGNGGKGIEVGGLGGAEQEGELRVRHRLGTRGGRSVARRAALAGGMMSCQRASRRGRDVPRVPPQPKARRCPKARRIEFPEDPLVESYYARHPEAKLQAYRLQGFDPPVARRFAWRQLELMQQQGLTKRQARDAVEAEFTRAEQEEEERAVQEWRRAIREGRQPAAVRCSAVEEVQQEERAHMLAGLEAMGAQLEAAAAEAEAEARAAQRSVGR